LDDANEYDGLDDADTNEQWGESETNGMDSMDMEGGSAGVFEILDTPAVVGDEGLEMLQAGAADTEGQLDDTPGDGQVRYYDGREVDGT
jgi:hypothetical protein